jgi:hypothetical protein
VHLAECVDRTCAHTQITRTACMCVQKSLRTVPSEDRRIREQVLPQVCYDVQTQIAKELASDSPIAVLVDGCQRRAGHMQMEAFLGWCSMYSLSFSPSSQFTRNFTAPIAPIYKKSASTFSRAWRVHKIHCLQSPLRHRLYRPVCAGPIRRTTARGTGNGRARMVRCRNGRRRTPVAPNRVVSAQHGWLRIFLPVANMIAHVQKLVWLRTHLAQVTADKNKSDKSRMR